MLDKLHGMARSRSYWLALIALDATLLVIALLYQYAWDEAPCVVCIHVRLLVSGGILLAGMALLVRRHRLLLVTCHALNTLLLVWLLERAWLLLGTERGTIIASCAFDLGLPAWLAFDSWLPALYQVQAACGQTPELLFGITMAEALVVLSAVLLPLSATLTAVTLLKRH